MSKLLHNSIGDVMQSWFESYLSNRKQYVTIKNSFIYVKHYSRCSARLGVGCHINDMHKYSNQMRFVHFADDTTVFASYSDINNLHATVNRELVGVDNWLKTNRLSLNVIKTSYMIVSNPKNAFDIKIRESIFTKVSTSNSLVMK